MGLICDVVMLEEDLVLQNIFIIFLDGLDFYYSSKQHAQKMVEFLQGVVPCRYVVNLNA